MRRRRRLVAGDDRRRRRGHGRQAARGVVARRARAGSSSRASSAGAASTCGSSTARSTPARRTWTGCAAASSATSARSPCGSTRSAWRPWTGWPRGSRCGGSTRRCSRCWPWSRSRWTRGCRGGQARGATGRPGEWAMGGLGRAHVGCWPGAHVSGGLSLTPSAVPARWARSAAALARPEGTRRPAHTRPGLEPRRCPAAGRTALGRGPNTPAPGPEAVADSGRSASKTWPGTARSKIGMASVTVRAIERRIARMQRVLSFLRSLRRTTPPMLDEHDDSFHEGPGEWCAHSPDSLLGPFPARPRAPALADPSGRVGGPVPRRARHDRGQYRRPRDRRRRNAVGSPGHRTG